MNRCHWQDAFLPGWTYKYKSDQFYPNVKFPFGFPVIDKSRNREFFIEIESIGGSENNSISINGEMGGFNAIYSFPRSYLQANPNEIPVFFISRLKMYLSHIAFLEFCIILGSKQNKIAHIILNVLLKKCLLRK